MATREQTVCGESCAEASGSVQSRAPAALIWACVVCVAALSFGCGDPRDVSVPLPIQAGAGARAEARPARAVVQLELRPRALGASCRGLTVSLPGATAAEALRTGAGERVSDGEDVRLACRVQADAEGSQSFGVEVSLEHRELPRMYFTGEVVESVAVALRLDLALVEGDVWQASCSGVARVIRPGAAWLELGECRDVSRNGRPEACGVRMGVLLEDCAR